MKCPLVFCQTSSLHKSAVDFGLWRGARREHTRRSVTDEQRSQGPKDTRNYVTNLSDRTLGTAASSIGLPSRRDASTVAGGETASVATTGTNSKGLLTPQGLQNLCHPCRDEEQVAYVRRGLNLLVRVAKRSGATGAPR